MAYAYGQGQLPASNSATVEIAPCKGRDLGDAPDSSNHFDADMSAYPGVPALFPTVFDHHTGNPPGPLHRNATAVHLGRGVSLERDADLPPDQDGFTNLLPFPREAEDVADVASLNGFANLDGFDDGVRLPAISPCEAWVDLPVTITVDDPDILTSDAPLYLNMWVDGNHDGDWADSNLCGGTIVSEWVLQDHTIDRSTLVPGTQIVTVTTLPVYRTRSSDGGVLPAWMRVTLSEGQAPHVEAPQVATVVVPETDGRGPEDGWALGETEDYYLPGTSRPPVAIDKTADKSTAALGDEIEFTISLSNPTTDAAKVLVYDQIPNGTEYISGTFTSSVPGILEGYNKDLNAVLWQGFVPGEQVVVITFRVQVVRCHPEGSAVLNTAWSYDYKVSRANSASVRVKIEPCTGPDLGDAPDSTNHFLNTPMTAYPSVPAEFPTVFDAASGAPPGPLHHNAYAVHLGDRVSFERDADQPPDQDGVPNLRPRHDQANLDRHDDAFPDGLPPIDSCQSWENLPVAITVNDPAILQTDAVLYLNMWVDGNHDGAWTGTNLCGNSSEWVLENHAISWGSLSAGANIVNVTTLPVYRAESTNGQLPAWLRITLSDSPVPIPEAPAIPDGSGPADGWALGETEDYYLPGDPAISIDKVADREVAAAGDEIEFTVTLSNASAEPARVTMYDLIPPGTEYIPETYASTVQAIEQGFDVGARPDFGVTRHWIVWRGDVPDNGTVEISFKVRVVRCGPDDYRVINDAWAFEPGLPPVSATAVVRIEPCHMADLGDAPDSSNHYSTSDFGFRISDLESAAQSTIRNPQSAIRNGMTAYPGVPAQFPTVFDPATGTPPGPLHRRLHRETWLGLRVSGESDADLLPDEDGVTNIDPLNDSANHDRYDDGLILPAASPFPNCEPTEIKVVVTVAPDPTGATVPIRERFINAWFDWNRDGDWEDAFDCGNSSSGDRIGALEWAVRDYEVRLGPGVHVIELPAFLPYNLTPGEDLWARVTLSDDEAPENPDSHLADGRGPEDGYRDGETEDYLIPGRRKLTIHKQVDRRYASLGDTLTYTITVINDSGLPALNAHVEDEVPEATSFIAGTLQASKPVTGFVENTVTWDGDVEAGETVTISFQVRVGRPNATDAAESSICGDEIHNRATLTLANGEVYDSARVLTRVHCPDLGDAPDSSNHFNARMTAYGVVTARFPTVYQSSSDPAVGPPGPLHWRPRADAWLGYWVSGERDADLLPDEDGRPNLKPPHDDADLDRADDGLIEPVRLPRCGETEIKVLVNRPGPSPEEVSGQTTVERYINVWFDWNRDGDWEDTFQCKTESGRVVDVPEWAVQDHLATLEPGLQDLLLPAFPVYNPTPHLPIWARVTLAEQPAPLNPDSSRADGRGPEAGYRYGETEDYLIPGVPHEPELKIGKRVDKLHASPGEVLEYTIAVENGSNTPETGVHVEDEIPDHTTFVNGSLSASKPTAGYSGGVVTWDGDVAAGELVTISFKVRVNAENDVSDEHDERCGDSIHNRAVLALPSGISMASNEVSTYILCPDLGDAPDSTNHDGAAMTTYAGHVPANFPTVFDPTIGLPQGPIHLQPTQDAWLGPRDAPPTGERDADRMPDADGRTNIDPPANKANRDEHDNGVFRDTLTLQHCEPATFEYEVTIVGPQRERFVNVWFDWNRDGDWEDTLDCPGAPAANEWAVQNQVLTLGPGTHTLTTPIFMPWHPDPGNADDPIWMRITLADRPVGTALATDAGDVIPTDGSGPATGYKYGETEDYLLGDVVSPDPPDVWVTKELRFVDFDEEAADANKQPPARFFFHIKYGNSGGSSAAGVIISDTLPISTTYKGSHSVPDIEPPTVVTTVVTSTVSWDAGTVSPGDHGFIDLWFHVPAHLFWVLPPGTVLTNTATITTSTPGDDPANNTSVVTGTIPLLPPRITWPIPGTTCTGTLTVTGKSQLGTFVDLYADGVYTATASVDNSGNWKVPLTFSNGTHSIYARARTAAGKESDPSPTVVVVVDDTLAWDPMSMTFTTVAPNGFVWTQHIRNEKGRADPDGWSVFLPTHPDVTQQYTVTVRTCCSDPTVTLTVSNTVYNMTAIGDGWYQTVIDAPGDASASITLTVDCGGVTSSSSGSGLIDPDGYVFDVDVGLAAGKLSGQTVTAHEYDAKTSGWNRWPAELYESQTNPQLTGADGYYSFYTPAGDYRITVDQSTAYQGYRSWTLTVISSPVHLDIPLTKAYAGTQYAVSVDAGGFVPDTLEVVQGSVVQWTNNEATAGVWHSAMSDVDARTITSGWDSGLLNSGESYSRRFDTLGTFTYVDHENPALVGTIKVCYLYDFDCDSKVGVSDLQAAVQKWHTVSGKGNGYDARYDVNGDGKINIIDIQLAAMQWNWTAP
ncbi:MAG: GEVED domain-containing protein [Anaerolineae bacterium]